jgi:hypothetical protein
MPAGEVSEELGIRLPARQPTARSRHRDCRRYRTALTRQVSLRDPCVLVTFDPGEFWCRPSIVNLVDDEGLRLSDPSTSRRSDNHVVASDRLGTRRQPDGRDGEVLCDGVTRAV